MTAVTMPRRALLLGVGLIAALAAARPAATAFAPVPARLKGGTTPRVAPSPLHAAKKATKKAAAKKRATKKAAKTAAKTAARPAAAEIGEETVKKAELVAGVATRLGTTRAEGEAALAAVLDAVATEVAAGKRVPLPGFGTFRRRFREARTGRNPQTGEPVAVPAKFRPTFTASSYLKELCNPQD